MDARRSLRVSEALREELAELIEYELSDPRLSASTVTDVQVSPDLRHARVMVASGPDEARQREALAALDGARKYLRRELAGRLRLFRVPDLHFETETAGGAESRVEELLKRVRKNREKKSETGQF